MPAVALTRNPDGIEKKKPIALRLMPDELADAERMAASLGCTKSALARDAYLIGVESIKAGTDTASSSPVPPGAFRRGAKRSAASSTKA
ncbi:MAG: hypothetical protein EG825_00665 [Rhodocyclaceae bacterium]|nr:hypothetical protein [Rhodocyclaceae bacterium]